ncbi:predicted protein (plasmid) [Enterococcus faecalis DS5]|nr:predicted protein [Enterococcus faecalis DS5]
MQKTVLSSYIIRTNVLFCNNKISVFRILYLDIIKWLYGKLIENKRILMCFKDYEDSFVSLCFIDYILIFTTLRFSYLILKFSSLNLLILGLILSENLSTLSKGLL